MSKLNGFDKFDGFSNYKITYYAEKVQKTTDTTNENIRLSATIYVIQESLFFLETGRDRILSEVEVLEKKAVKSYDLILSLYRADCQLSCTGCPVVNALDRTGLETQKCQLNQLDALLVTIIEANKLANSAKMFLGIMVLRQPEVKKHLLLVLITLETWDTSTEETLESQLRREISLIANPYLRELFSDFIAEIVPILTKRLLEYEGCASVGARVCLICGENFEKTLYEPFPLQNWEKEKEIENKTDARQLYCSIFRKRFYRELVDFLNLVKTDY